MARKLVISVPTVLALILVSGLISTLLVWLLFPVNAGAQGGGNSGYVRRYAANFTTWGTPAEIETDLPPSGTPAASGGLLIYNKNFFTAADINTLYVTISATGDAHDGRRLMLACLVDGVACNSGSNPVGGAPAGWVTLLRLDNYNSDYSGPGDSGDGGGGAGDVHDNNITYTWCVPFETNPGSHNVQIRLASGVSPDADDPAVNNFVFLEGVYFFIDGSRIADAANACTRDPVDSTVAIGTTSVPLTEPSTLDAVPAESPHNR